VQTLAFASKTTLSDLREEEPKLFQNKTFQSKTNYDINIYQILALEVFPRPKLVGFFDFSQFRAFY
jgi:hypothetical protein